MGVCTYCQQPAGLLRSAHPECERRNEEATRKIRGFFVSFLNSTMNAAAFSEAARQIADAAQLTGSKYDSLVTSGFGDLIDHALADHLLTAEEESRIVQLRHAFGFSDDRFQIAGLQERLVKGAILRDLNERGAKNRITVSGNLPFLLQKSEELIWLFQAVDYHELKERVEYVGRSAGVSVRVAKGVYLRTGASKGQRISTQSLELVDHGAVGITTKHIYFKGTRKGFRIALSKLISVEQFSNGVGVMKDGANPKPQIFAVDDPWFAANLLANLG